MNLIDKRKLLNERPENLNPNMNDEIKSAYNKGWNACNSEWVSLIDEQPTAYDIDKVARKVERLIELEFKWLRAVLFEEGRITYSSLDIAERGIKETVKMIKAGEQE